MWQATRTFLLVFMLTALVWAYAASRQLTQEKCRVTVELTRPGPDLHVEITGEPIFDIALSGPQRLVADAVTQLERDNNVIRLPARAQLGPAEIPVGSLLEQSSVMRGLRVESARPGALRYVVDSIVRETIPVVIEPPPLMPFREGEPPKVTPPEITVSLPKAKWSVLREGLGEAGLVIRGKMSVPAMWEPDKPIDQTVTLERKIGDVPVELPGDGTVRVRCTFAAARQEKSLDAIPIHIRMKPEVGLEARIPRTETGTVSVKIEGPPASMALVKPENISAVVTVTSADKPGEKITKSVEVWVKPGHPPDVRVVIDPVETRITVTERSQVPAK